MLKKCVIKPVNHKKSVKNLDIGNKVLKKSVKILGTDIKTYFFGRKSVKKIDIGNWCIRLDTFMLKK
jgi:hypothetical protein